MLIKPGRFGLDAICLAKAKPSVCVTFVRIMFTYNPYVIEDSGGERKLLPLEKLWCGWKEDITMCQLDVEV